MAIRRRGINYFFSAEKENKRQKFVPVNITRNAKLVRCSVKCRFKFTIGTLAQLAERQICTLEAESSILSSSTNGAVFLSLLMQIQFSALHAETP